MKKNAPGNHKINESNNQRKHNSKQTGILKILQVRKLNKFEAIAFGNSFLHITIRMLREKSFLIPRDWEVVRNHFGGKTSFMLDSFTRVASTRLKS